MVCAWESGVVFCDLHRPLLNLLAGVPTPPYMRPADAERGFAIGVPGLKRGRISAQFLDCGVSNAYGYTTVADAFWRGWNGSSGTLTRILLIEAAAKRFGYAPDPFRGRFKKDDPNTDKVQQVPPLPPASPTDHPVASVRPRRSSTSSSSCPGASSTRTHRRAARRTTSTASGSPWQ